MPSFIVKPKRDEDFYVVYSTVVDAPTGWGARADFESAHMLHPQDFAYERFLRADEHGSSCLEFDRDGYRLGWYWWDEAEFTIMNGPGAPGTLPRDQLRAYCEVQELDEAAAAAMVKPADWLDD